MVRNYLALTVWYMPNFFLLADFLFVVQLICWEEGQLEKVCPLTLC